MVKRASPKGKKPTRSNARAVAQAQSIQSLDQAWQAIKAEYDPDVVSIVDGALDHGFSYQDLLKLELLEHFRLDKVIRHFLKRPGSSTLVQSLASIKLQCRKHMRSILASMGPGLTQSDMPVVVPEGMDPAAFETLRAELADDPDEIMS